jgi:hypothetical protein
VSEALPKDGIHRFTVKSVRIPEANPYLVLRTLGDGGRGVWNCSCRITPCWTEPPKSKYHNPDLGPNECCVHLQRAWYWFRDMTTKAIDLLEQHKKQMAESAHEAIEINTKRKITLR